MQTIIQLDVPDMDCGGCVRAITDAVHKLDATAEVKADLTTKRVSIAGAWEIQDYVKAVDKAGFTVRATA